MVGVAESPKAERPANDESANVSGATASICRASSNSKPAEERSRRIRAARRLRPLRLEPFNQFEPTTRSLERISTLHLIDRESPLYQRKCTIAIKPRDFLNADVCSSFVGRMSKPARHCA